MDKSRFVERLNAGLSSWQIALPSEVAAGFSEMADGLLRWNAKVNLTAITAEDEVVEKHFLDSVAVLPEIAGATHLLDLGAGAGFPGLPLALAAPDVKVVLADAVAKKVGFIKHVIATLRLAPRVRALHVRAEGAPEREGLSGSDVAVSRAFLEPEGWLALAKAYVVPGGRVVAMLGRAIDDGQAASIAAKHEAEFVSGRRYALPFSGAERQVLVFRTARGLR